MKHYFLGQAANFKIRKIFRLLFSFGTKRDFDGFKQDLAKKYQVNPGQVYLFHSGRTALSLALLSSIPSNEEKEQPVVAITALTCYAVVQAVKTAGFKPLYLDIDPKTLHFTAETLKKALNDYPNLRAVVVQNNLGLPVNMLEIEKITRQSHLLLVEDLAHSLDIVYPDGRIAGSVGDAVILSFGKGKALDAISGGALIMRQSPQNRILQEKTIASKRPKLSDSLRDRFYPLFGLLVRSLSYIPLGKHHLGQFLTALLVKLHLVQKSADAELNFSRRLTYWQAKYLRRELKQYPSPHSPLRYAYLVKNRTQVLRKLKQAGFYFDEIWYDSPVSPKRYFSQSGFDSTLCPVANELSQHLVNLPAHYPLSCLSQARLIIYQSEIDPAVFGAGSSSSYQEQVKTLNSAPTSSPLQLANFLQSTKWQHFNQQIGHQVIVEKISGSPPIILVIKDAKRGRFMEISNGPLLDWSNYQQVQLVFSKICERARQNRCVFIRFRPALEDNQTNRALVSVLKTLPASFHLNAEHTVMLDLTPPEDQLLANFRRQTRYEVRRAEKLGIKVKEQTSNPNIFKEFYQVQQATARRQHFIPPTLEELTALRDAFKQDIRVYVAYTKDDQPIAYSIILLDGVEADYFEAASTSLNLQLPGAYALQWHIIKELKKQGLERYNLWGIAPPHQSSHRYAGVTTFKTGFGGQRFSYLHAQDIPLQNLRYQINRLIETIRKKYRHLS